MKSEYSLQRVSTKMTKADVTSQRCQGLTGDRVLSCWFSWIDLESKNDFRPSNRQWVLGSVSMAKAWRRAGLGEVVMTQKGNVIEIKTKCVRFCFKWLPIHSGFGTQQEWIHYWLETQFWRHATEESMTRYHV